MKKVKLSGSTLVEVLMALFVLGIVIPTSLGALGSVLTAELKIIENVYMISSAEWWLSRLTLPVSATDLDAAPKTDRHEKVRFDWDTESLDNGAIRVTLRVHGRLNSPPLTISRIF